MSCENFKERLVGLLYDELGSSEREEIDAHLSSCGACRGEMERLTEARSLLAGAMGGVPQAPRVMVLRPSLASRSWIGIAASAFFAGALASAGFFAGMRVGAAQPPPRETSASASELQALQASFDRRLAEQRQELQARIDHKEPASAVSQRDLVAELDKLERKVDGWRETDVEYLLGQLAAVEKRQSTQLGQTQEALRYVALSRDPRVSEQ